jgi:hypothetical protein
VETGICRYCQQQNKELVESHLVSAAIYDLCEVDGEFAKITEKSVGFTGRHLKHPLLCGPCDGSLSVNGEDYTIPLLADIHGNFPFYDLIVKVPPDCAEDDVAGYAVARNPEINVKQITHFALGVFWKASVHSWRKGETKNWIELGPYREEIRKFLRGEGPFPKYVGLTLGIIPRPVKQISFCLPYRGSRDACHYYMFYVPGIAFALSVGKRLGDAKENCFYSNPLHPVVATPLAGDIKAVMQNVAKNAHFSKRVIQSAKVRR